MKTYTFHITAPHHPNVWRSVELLEIQTLNDLHLMIQQTFGWQNDHLYAFYLKTPGNRIGQYEIPEYMDSDPDADKRLLMFSTEPDYPKPSPKGMLTPGMTTEFNEFFRDMSEEEQRRFLLFELRHTFDVSDETPLPQLYDYYREYLRWPRDVTYWTLKDLNLTEGQSFVYVFDYGAKHTFGVQVYKINENHQSPKSNYPLVLETAGIAPPQYDDYEAQILHDLLPASMPGIAFEQRETLEPFSSKLLNADFDVHAPDGSEIRLLAQMRYASMVHCTLPPGKVSKAIHHRTVDEIWYFLSGHGELWRKLGDQEDIVTAKAGLSVTITAGTHFQFRATGDEPLVFICMTIPPWPGEDEAVFVDNHWSDGG